MKQNELNEVLRLHAMWLRDEDGGKRADLRGADLRGANLSLAKGIISFGPMPTSGRMIYAVKHNKGWMVKTGCFWGTLDELEAAVKIKHNCQMYLGIINLVRSQQ